MNGLKQGSIVISLYLEILLWSQSGREIGNGAGSLLQHLFDR